MSTQSRYLLAAQRVMTQAGGDPALADALAAWGQQAHQSSDTDARAVVAQDGSILAHARSHRGPAWAASATYMNTDEVAAALGVAGMEISLALGHIRKATGQDVIVVSTSDLAWTPYRRTDLPRPRLTSAQVADLAGVKPATVRGYLARAQMPEPDGRDPAGPYWWEDTIQAWLESRPGQGARTDRRIEAQ